MIILFRIDLVCEDKDIQGRRTLCKKFDYPTDKPLDRSFKDGAWQGLKEATSFTVQIKEGTIVVLFAETVLATKDLLAKEEKRFRLYGWKPADEWRAGETIPWDKR
jgi:hypothetical protein